MVQVLSEVVSGGVGFVRRLSPREGVSAASTPRAAGLPARSSPQSIHIDVVNKLCERGVYCDVLF